MSNAKTRPIAKVNSEVEAVFARLLHDLRNQLGGMKLYAVYLKNSLANNTLEAGEGMDVCEKILQQINRLSAQTNEAGRILQTTPKKKA